MLPTRRQQAVAAALAAVGGAVDAIGFLSLAHVFTAHMSGNTAGLGADLGMRHWSDALRRAAPIPCFIGGVIAGAVVLDRWPSLRLALGVEAALLVAFYLVGVGSAGSPLPLPAVALPALAMGIQCAITRRAGLEDVRTTFITGMLADATEDAAAAARPAAPGRGGLVRDALLRYGLWLVFTLGAFAASLLYQLIGLAALSFPLLLLAMLMIGGCRRSAHPSPRGPADERASAG